ncbi:MAG: NAD(P)/FAD-dependent oxidoreductase [Methanomassiliicoccales archaeon]|nr:NAD(P)/FAD-dependent oxidoreductase [Methanomassiliicoccales archaeon]
MYDVIVVGAGPAGCYSAYLCAKAGLETLLLEKDRLPRRKCCAGGVLERAARKLDFPIPGEVVEREVHGAVVCVGGHRHELRFGERVAFTVRRERFDAFLARKAEERGATLVEGARVERASERSDHVEVAVGPRIHQARCLVLADGVGSRLAGPLLGPYAQERFAAGMSYNLGLEGQPDDLMEFHFYPQGEGRSPPRYGYGWMFPTDHGANIGAGGLGFDRAFIVSEAERIEASCSSRFGKVTWREELAGHPLPLYVRRRLHSPRTMAVGDSGGLANPITGEGMSYAFASALLAAEAAAGVCAGDASATELYERRCRDSIVRDLDAARYVERAVRALLTPLDLDRFFDAFCSSEELCSACLGIVRDESDWRLLLRRALPRMPWLYFRSL